MDKEARKIARHHLGDALGPVYRGGPHGDDWIVSAFGDDGAKVSARAPTVDAAAVGCAAQLRAAGWEPRHARLEWQTGCGGAALLLHIDAAQFSIACWRPVAVGTEYGIITMRSVAGDVRLLVGEAMPLYVVGSIYPESELVQKTVEWCATNLPSLHLPPFPETPHA